MMLNDRPTQLREAKRRQRQRERETGMGLYQVRLPMQELEKLKAGMRDQRFIDRLQHFIQIEVLNVKDYPQLHLLCWARHSDHITRSDAFSLYEGNWRFIDENALDVGERQLITALSSEFGKGVINA
ncbi:MAG: hypothetical protein QGG98_04100 [Pseudomonadales bacterium]|jgi:hypothetical protein|nr:hypothetical protein [Pseudomonadales bacterium]MDP7357304.1 hypothetical protein [Pseudomonadales bacterium]|tara:strand:- start:1588 stop:1968 length:381 start_codon:yes stop_codon:yes gene_type:complete